MGGGDRNYGLLSHPKLFFMETPKSAQTGPLLEHEGVVQNVVGDWGRQVSRSRPRSSFTHSSICVSSCYCCCHNGNASLKYTVNTPPLWWYNVTFSGSHTHLS